MELHLADVELREPFRAEAERLVTKWRLPGDRREAMAERIRAKLEACSRVVSAVPDRSSPVLNEAERIMAMEVRRDLFADQAAELEIREWRAAHPEGAE